MPLIKGKSPESFSKNVKTEYEAGKPLKQSLAIAYSMKKKAKKMAEGGYVHEEEASGYEEMPCRMCEGGSCPKHMMAEGGEVEDWKDDEHTGEDIAGRLKRGPRTRFEEYEEREPEEESHEDDDLVGRILKKRMSKGGMVANEDHGPMDDRLAGFDQNEFDDLSLRDDLEFHDTGANSGDEIGDKQEDEDRRDIVSRIMKSRSMKDRMPIAGYGTSYGRNK